MDEVGIYRISGTTSEISTLKAAFNNSKKNITQKNYLFVGKCSDKELLQCKEQMGVSFTQIFFNMNQTFSASSSSFLNIIQDSPFVNSKSQ